MTTLITDSDLEQRLKEQRRAWGADGYDEVWEGVTMMTPLPNDEHQGIVAGLVSILQDVVAWPRLGKVRPGVNLAGTADDWTNDYRVPDVAVFLQSGTAQNLDTHWRGPADFLVEIVSEGDHSREKIPFYSRIGVRELLLVDRDPWSLELYRHQDGTLKQVGQSTPSRSDVLASQSVPLQFQLLAAQPRPTIHVTHPASGRTWDI